ncbi:MAG: flavohemoglobin expression-modulating QEGLA motif protein [Magnetococcales bacterium]|nr:flavohemoglobin expression-modulating QEGLA motif protein [Magnetococcales bacterium]
MTNTAPEPLSEPVDSELFQALFSKGVQKKSAPIQLPLPDGGTLHLDRIFPFLCYYRSPTGSPEPGVAELISGESAFFISHGPRDDSLLKELVGHLAPQFGDFLLFQIWSLPAVPKGESQGDGGNQPAFQIVSQLSPRLEGPVKSLTAGLRQCGPDGKRSLIQINTESDHFSEPWYQVDSLFQEGTPAGLHRLGVGIQSFFQSLMPDESGGVYPVPHRNLRRCLSLALRKALYRFTCFGSAKAIPHFQALGPRSVTEKTWQTDHRLADISKRIDYLMYVTPINVRAAWQDFSENGFVKPPVFFYRPLPFDPVALKRTLFRIPVDSVDDPALEALFREKSEELDSQINLLRDCGSDRFLPESLQLFGGVKPALRSMAETLLQQFSSVNSDQEPANELEALQLEQMAWEEIAHYRASQPGFGQGVEIRPEMPSNFLVSNGKLLLGPGTKATPARATALLQHEIGVHMLTQFNGLQQPLHLLSVGFGNYESFQEGLAVMAEYLAGGLTVNRLRVLAARVVAVSDMIQGATFVQTFAMLHEGMGFSKESAFSIAMRVHRGGGLTKDAIYLSGLVDALDYLAGGGTTEPLWMGKMSRNHLPIIQELLWREVLIPPTLQPRFLTLDGAAQRMETIRQGAGITTLTSG